MNEIEVTQSNTGTYTVNFECPDGEELSKTNARVLFEESAISEVIDDLNMHRGDHALLARIAELEENIRQAKNCVEMVAANPRCTKIVKIYSGLALEVLKGAGK